VTYDNIKAVSGVESAKLSAARRLDMRVFKPYVFLLPSFVFFIGFYYFPFLKTILLSTTITNAAGEIKKFVGISNFIMIFKRPDFYVILKNTARFVPMVALPTLFVSMLLALFANRKVRRVSTAVEVLFSLPMAVASASAAIVWGLMFNPLIGSLNYILGTDIRWLTDEKWAMASVAIVTVWLQLGVNFIFLLTGLRGIPTDVEESAMIDGARGLKKFLYVTLPMISPTLFFVIFYNIMASFQAFGQIRLLTQGGPGISTKVLVYDVYLEAFLNFRFGTAAAESIILFAIMLSVALLQFRFENKGVHYS